MINSWMELVEGLEFFIVAIDPGDSSLIIKFIFLAVNRSQDSVDNTYRLLQLIGRIVWIEKVFLLVWLIDQALSLLSDRW